MLVDGVRWRVRTGVPWRDLPCEYGPWQTVYGLFRRWQRQGVWARLLTLLQARADVAGLITWEINVDSTVCRAHQHAGTAPGRKNRPAGLVTSRTTTGWAGLGWGFVIVAASTSVVYPNQGGGGGCIQYERCDDPYFGLLQRT